jgi:tRNA threonylcarbamoyl adenosine modification protein YjeE
MNTFIAQQRWLLPEPEHLPSWFATSPLTQHQRFALIGTLGAGKTTWVQAWAAFLQVEHLEQVTSPSYSLMHQYSHPAGTLSHIDLYRLSNIDDLQALGLLEALEQSDWLAVEWADRFPALWPHIPPLTWLHFDIDKNGQHWLEAGIYACP